MIAHRLIQGFVMLLTLVAATSQAFAQVPAECYRVEDVATPPHIAPEVSAIAFDDDGRLFAAFRRGYVFVRDPETLQWSPFASGLQTPMGIIIRSPDEMLVGQMPELTRIVDEDGDGRADVYETLCDAWGMSGNYHEFVSGPVADAAGNLYVALHCASSAAGDPRLPVRGALTPRGRDRARYQHFSATPWRGWVLKIAPDGTMTPVSCGLRQPNGLVVSPDGELFVTDNQGDWVGTSPLHHVTPGAFHGHPTSLVWDPTFAGDPIEAPIGQLKAMRKMPAIQFPQQDMAGSIAQPVFDTTDGRFGPYKGQMLVAEFAYPRLLRATLEKVDGQYQGACFILLEGHGLRTSNHRMAFAPDGSLYVAQTSRGWGAVEGLQRIVWSGKTPFDLLDMKLAHDGFELTFTKPVDRASAGRLDAYALTHYYYKYHAEYGSPKMDVTPAAVERVTVSADGLRVRLRLGALRAERVYELRPVGIRSEAGEALVTRLAAYTVNRLRRGER